MSTEKMVDMETESKSAKSSTTSGGESTKTGKSANLNESLDDSTSLPKQMIADLNVKHDLKLRENIYRLIISQLFYDGYQHIAVGLSGAIQVRNLY